MRRNLMVAFGVGALFVSILVGFTVGVATAPREGIGYASNGPPRPFNGELALLAVMICLAIAALATFALARRIERKP